MKKVMFLLMIIISVTSVTYAQSTWQWQNPQPAGSYLYSNCFLNSSTGWIIGDGTVLKTTDNGGTWSTTFLDPFLHRLASVSFLNENFGILTADNCAYKSTDGGNNWIKMNFELDFYGWWFSSCMITETTGWIVGHDILKTTNGGLNWISKYSFQYESFRSVFFINQMTGWVAGDLGYLRTTNGGENWIFTEIPDLRKVYFASETTGWMLGNGLIMKSTDGGINWITLNEYTDIADFYFNSENAGWAARSFGEILKTSNGGNNWWVQSNTGSENTSIYFDSSMSGWVIGRTGSIKKTSNGGEDWISLNSRFTQNIMNSVFFISESNGWTVGESGSIFSTTNSGINWNAQQSGVNSNLKAVCFANSETGWAAGTDLIKTTNSGVNWIAQSIGIIDIRSISFISLSTGWLAGGSKVLKTTDIGENWITILDNDLYNLNSVFFISAQTGWTAGKFGKILKTTNGGSNWTEQMFPDDYVILYSVYFSSETTGYAVGGTGPGRIYKTTNGGDLWVNMPFDRSQTSELRSVYFTDNNNGWVAGNFGNLMKTINGGINWEYCSNGAVWDLYSIFFASDSVGWAVGEMGTIVKTTTGSQQPIASEDIIGNNSVLINSTNLYYTESVRDVHWNISNYDSTDAEIISDPHNDSVYVFSGNHIGHFVLYLSSSDSILNSKHVYIDNPLPVELTNFSSMISSNDVTLKWSTSSEINNSGFDIERRDAGCETQDVWVKTGFVIGNGNSSEIHNYEFAEKGLNPGKYNYRLKQLDFNGNFEYFELAEEVIIGIPLKYNLSQNFPNPFNPVTTINYDLPNDGIVTVRLYDILGREMRTLVNEMETAGYYKLQFNAADLSSGVYFYRMTAGDYIAVKKFVVLK